MTKNVFSLVYLVLCGVSWQNNSLRIQPAAIILEKSMGLNKSEDIVLILSASNDGNKCSEKRVRMQNDNEGNKMQTSTLF